MVYDLYLVIDDGFEFVGLPCRCFAVVEFCLHLLQALDGLVEVRLHQLVFGLLDFQLVAIAPNQERQRQCRQCGERQSQQGPLEAGTEQGVVEQRLLGVILSFGLEQFVVHAAQGHRVGQIVGLVQVVDGVVHVMVVAREVGQQLVVHDAVGDGCHLRGVLQVIARRVGASQVEVGRSRSVMDSRVNLEFAQPADGLEGIVLCTRIVAACRAELGPAEEVGHDIRYLDFPHGQVDGRVDVVEGAVLLLLVDAVQAAQLAQADNLVMLVIQSREQGERFAVLAGAQGLGSDDLALVQFAHHHLGHGAVLQVFAAGDILGLPQAGDGFVKLA